ncbi:DUF423 domain-containing protein [Nafulsella turpanensis]|uniref:DUF423 domain-containing protein n=1 Tax=Nafulsella turpanensis TaxID=1265690 RepID=UPI00034A4C7A|nr:DUF423 domain-containing protein [Nafulsella turpanensis]
MQKIFLLWSAALGALGVMIGAFGAHALSAMLEQTGRTATFETAVKYQMYHTLALLATALLLGRAESRWFEYAGWAYIAGIIIFSGSLYILCLSNVGKWGAVTPIGGLALIAAWVCLFIGVFKNL